MKKVGEVEPYSENFFNTFIWQGGVEIRGSGDTTISFNRGDWIGVSGVNFSKGASSITITAWSGSGITLKVTTYSPSGTAVSYITIPGGDANSFNEATGEISDLNGTKNIFFTDSGDYNLKSYKFS